MTRPTSITRCFLCRKKGRPAAFKGYEMSSSNGLFSSLNTDRGSHYWFTPTEGGRVSKTQLTRFGRAMKHLGIEMIPAYSPQARGRSERAFQTHQDRLVKELALHGITEMDAANRYLAQRYRPAFNAEFMQPASEEGSAFVPWKGENLDDVLCEQNQRPSALPTASALRE